MRHAGLLVASLAASVAVLALGGCSVLVQPDDLRVRCEVQGALDPCPQGQRCLDGFCTALPDGGVECMEQEIGCNGIDDDCDGAIDEGSDADGDGFTWCDPDPRLRDCRDDNPSVHPGGRGIPAPEDPPCDGVDNDCDGVATECPVGQACDPTSMCRVPDCTFAFACPNGERCDTSVSPARCEFIETDCFVTGCPAGLVCDPFERTCESPRQLGQVCAADAQCVPGAICVASASLGLAFEDVGGDAVCSRTCCTDGDCGLGARCWASGTGARGCVPDAILRAGPAGVPTDAACSENADCAGECALRTSPGYRVPARRAYTCGAPIGTSRVECDYSDDCRSGACAPFCVGFLCGYACSSACGATSDCTSVERCGWGVLSGMVIQTCRVGRDGAAGGAACAGDSDCRDGACIGAATGRYCADVCCADEHCPSGSRCRPVANHGRYEMLCVRE